MWSSRLVEQWACAAVCHRCRTQVLRIFIFLRGEFSFPTPLGGKKSGTVSPNYTKRPDGCPLWHKLGISLTRTWRMTCATPRETICQNITAQLLSPRWRGREGETKNRGANCSAGLTAEILVILLCNSMHVAAKLVRSRHIPAMPKQALLTAAHFSCAPKFNSAHTLQ